MIYVLAINNQVQKYPYSLTDLQLDNPNVSFPQDITIEELNQFNVFEVVETEKPAIDPITQNLVWENPLFVSEQWIQQWGVEAATQEQIAERELSSKQYNKGYAENLLQQSDWTAIPSIADPAQSNPYLTNQNDFFEYRNQLRVIAINPPVVVDVWPTKPNEVWSS